MSVVIGILLQSAAWYTGVKQHWPRFVLGWATINICQFLLISPSDETFNRGPSALLLRRRHVFPFGINIVQFYFFFLHTSPPHPLEYYITVYQGFNQKKYT